MDIFLFPSGLFLVRHSLEKQSSKCTFRWAASKLDSSIKTTQESQMADGKCSWYLTLYSRLHSLRALVYTSPLSFSTLLNMFCTGKQQNSYCCKSLRLHASLMLWRRRMLCNLIRLTALCSARTREAILCSHRRGSHPFCESSCSSHCR